MIAAIQLILEVLLVGAATLLILAGLGYGPTRILLPSALAEEGVLWTPFVGYTFASIVFHALNVQFLDGLRTAVVLLSLGVIATGVAAFVRRSIGSPPPTVFWIIVLASSVAFLMGVAPLLAIGELTAIGKNYDVIDIYDAVAAYVIDYPVNSILSSSPPNPLAQLIAGPIPLSNGWGLSYLHALSSMLTMQSPVETQTPVFSVMHALVVPASFIFLRRTVGLSNWFALAISALLGVHGMLLSMLFIGLGNHTAMLALLPVVFASTFLAIDERTRRSAIFAGFVLTNIPLTYWAAFPFFLPPVFVYVLIGPGWPVVRRLTTALTSGHASR
jgi:hypothetical protein